MEPLFPFPEVWDNTMISAARKCPQSWAYAHGQKLAANDTNIHLHAGGAFARGLEVARKSYFVNKQTEEDSIALGALALIKEYGDFTPPDNQAKTLDNLLGAIGHYFLQWPLSTSVPPAILADKAAIEWNFALPIPGIKHPVTGGELTYCGRFDTIDDYKGMLMGGDDKTATQLGQQWINRWRLANQITGYCWGANEYGIPLTGFRLRGISILKTQYGHSESIVYRKAWQLHEFVNNLQATLRHLIDQWQKGYFEKNWADACSAYNGCDFLILCESQNPQTWIPVNFKTRDWNPLASRD